MALPDRDQQIIQSHAVFICQAVELAQRTDARPQFDALLAQAEQSGWTALAQAIRFIAAGQRDLSLIQNLDEEDQIVAEAIMRGMQDPATLPDPTKKADPALAAPGLAQMIIEASRGNVQALTLISQMAEQMSKAGGDMATVASIIRPLINGERNADKLCDKLDPRAQQLVLNILEELGKLDIH